jgi:hypothetical protein
MQLQKRLGVVAAIASLLVTVAVVAGDPPAEYENFILCRDGNPACDFSTLTTDQINAVVASTESRMFTACVDEAPTCDVASLTPDQQAKLSEARQQRKQARLAPIINSGLNFARCAYGEPECNRALLTTDQRNKLAVYAAEHTVIPPQAAATTHAPEPAGAPAPTPARSGNENLKKFGVGLLQLLGAVARAYLEVESANSARTPIVVSGGSSVVVVGDGFVASTSALVESRIDGQFAGWTGETLFKLQNGQIWQQVSYSFRYRYAYSPRVVIYKSGYGYKMQVDGVDEHIAVKRLK